MWFAGLAVGLPELFIAVVSIFVGVPTVLIAWVDIINERVTANNWRIPTALHAFTASVLMYLASLFSSRIIPSELLHDSTAGVRSVQYVMACFIICGFIFLIISMVLVRRNSGPGTRVLKIGSKVLVVIALLGFIGIIGCLPQAPWNQN